MRMFEPRSTLSKQHMPKLLAVSLPVSLALFLALASLGLPAAAVSYERISGEGSSWAANAIDAMRVNVKQYGMTVDYTSSGSTSGRKNFLSGTVDFAASDIPFQFKPEDGSPPENPAPGSYAYIPVTAGGTSFMYNLKINGQRVTNLRLSGENVAKIFTGKITKWNDPALQADNPGLTLPDRAVVPVVRSDGSGSTAQFTQWLIAQHNAIWMDYCTRTDRAPACGSTSYYPPAPGMIAQSGDPGVSGYISQSLAEGAIGYVNYSYALGVDFPVAKVLNASGYYTEPTPKNVAVALLKARINTDKDSKDYLTQQLDDVYTDTDPRNYPLSSYSYFILPTTIQGQFNEGKGRTLGAFTYYAMCQAQQQSESLGYSPLPVNLVQAGFEQIRKIPGVEEQTIDLKDCHNPTFSPDGTNLLAAHAPMPQECDKLGPSQCATGTGGARSNTAVAPGASGGGGGGTTAGGTTTGGSNAAGTAAGGPSQDAGASGTATGSGGRSGSSGAGTARSNTSAAGGCDVDTGVCDSTGASGMDASAESSTEGSSNGTGNQQAVASSTVLPASSGWSASETVAVLIFLLTMVLVLGPPLAWRRFSIAGEKS